MHVQVSPCTKGLDRAETSIYGAETYPDNDKSWEIVARLEMFDKQVRRYVNDDVRDVENQERHVELDIFQFQVLGKTSNAGIANVRSI